MLRFRLGLTALVCSVGACDDDDDEVASTQTMTSADEATSPGESSGSETGTADASAGSAGETGTTMAADTGAAETGSGVAISQECQQCAGTNCPDEVAACVADEDCLACNTNYLEPLCPDNEALQMVCACAATPCADECAPYC